ncbi:hypothetical protein ACA29_09350 [Lederbergia galactosidilytica]|uniref:Uncharacterized protein n=1 Tax=Lederbergia galactosidilytica TaxID=217031 RepID=A0A0Q9XX02_9BACI|nr:hypothetical protein ACA29_09350 [Lederbergia galactosidilytica]
MSLEELLALREELQISVDEEKSVSLSALIGVEEELLRRLARQKKSESPFDEVLLMPRKSKKLLSNICYNIMEPI